ncbi:MAG TPA: AcrB/AcrD/AcrF family protein, partial [Microscillaceae bacterium]|nr:AcrB/AcrD/AcrF family protein [Microscillaceae bacterium]
MLIYNLLNRPIAVCTTVVSLCVLGILALQNLPISLLPDIEIPEITVRVNYPNHSGREIHQLVTLPIKKQLQLLNNLQHLDAISQDNQMLIKLRFNYGTDVQLAFIEVNEQIDKVMQSLPKDMERPMLIKANPGDIPVFVLNVFAKKEAGTKYQNPPEFLRISNFSEQVLRSRIEQLPEVAFVDISGLAKVE